MQLRRALARLGHLVVTGGGVGAGAPLAKHGAVKTWVSGGEHGLFAAATERGCLTASSRRSASGATVVASRGYAAAGVSAARAASWSVAGGRADVVFTHGGAVTGTGGGAGLCAAMGGRGFRTGREAAGGIQAGGAWGVTVARGYAKASNAAKEVIKTLKLYKPTSPGQRGRITTVRDSLWKGKPYKPLTVGLRKSGGRNNHGRITVWHRGGGHKRLYRMVDFQRKLRDVTGIVRRIEYDPNRTTRIALVDYEGDAKPAYLLAVDGMKAGDTVRSGDSNTEIRPGNAMPISSMPVGTNIHNIELRPGQGGKLVRAAGTTAVLVKKGEGGYATVKLPSGEQRLILNTCYATVGMLSNREHHNRVLGKAGAKRWLGVRPTTRGVAMNPIDHPHGGGEGRTSGGRPSCTPWGVQTKGKRTRNNKKTDNMRVSRRPTGKLKSKK